MPSHSKKQHNFMEAIAHSPSFAKKVGVPQSVGKDYAEADKGRKFSKGGDMAGNTRAKKFRYGGDVVDEVSYDGSPSFGTEASLRRGRPLTFRELRPEPRMAQNSIPVEPRRPIEPPPPIPVNMPRGMKKGGNVKNGYADGGLTMVKKDGKMVPDFAADGVGKMAKGGMAESKEMIGKEVAFMKKKGAPASMIKHEKAEAKGMKKGGSIDGCAQRGKTRLKYGGMC
jgi:hypothetical protein